MQPLHESLETEIKELVIEELVLKETVSEIATDTPLFQKDGLGLDSVDQLQLALVIERVYGLQILLEEDGERTLYSIGTIVDAIEKSRSEVTR